MSKHTMIDLLDRNVLPCRPDLHMAQNSVFITPTNVIPQFCVLLWIIVTARSSRLRRVCLE